MSDDANAFDAWGRLLSDDGRWYWDGAQWQENHSLPPLPYAEAHGDQLAPRPEPAVPTESAATAVEPAGSPLTTPPPEPAAPLAAVVEASVTPVAPIEHAGSAPFAEFSPDGRWGWNGVEWVDLAPGAAAPPAVSPPIPHPTRESAPPQPPPPPAHDPPTATWIFDPAGEAKRYPPMWRLAGRALRDVPALLEPGETVLATAPGEGDMAELRHLVGLTIVTGYHFDPAYLLVATDRRVLALGLTASASKVQRVHTFPYGAITHWSARMSRAATLVTRTGFIALAAEPDEAAGMKRIPGQLFEEVRAQIEPRLDPAVLASGGKQ